MQFFTNIFQDKLEQIHFDKYECIKDKIALLKLEIDMFYSGERNCKIEYKENQLEVLEDVLHEFLQSDLELSEREL